MRCDYAFWGCTNLTNITIPDGLTDISYMAFKNCRRLKNVYYDGSKEKWKFIVIDENNECLKNATIHYNQDGRKVSGESDPNNKSGEKKKGTFSVTLDEHGVLNISGSGNLTNRTINSVIRKKT